MLRFPKHHGAEPERDDWSLDFGRALPNQLGPMGQVEDSATLWVPGKPAQESFAPGLSQSLNEWRANNKVQNNKAQTPLAKATEELNAWYESLPEGARDLTFQDLVEQKNSPKESGGRKDYAAKNLSAKKKLAGNQKDAYANGKTMRVTNENKKNSPSFVVSTKLSAMLSPKREFSSPKQTRPTPEQVDKLFEKRAKKPSKLEGLYSASSSPTASFRRVSPDSPLGSARLSPKNSSVRRVSPDSPLASARLSPKTSFSDYMLPINRHTFERELSGSLKFLDLINTEEDSAAWMPAIGSRSPLRELIWNESRSPRRSKSVHHASDCSMCSMANLVLETRCLECGKPYCNKCKDFATEETPFGRKCMDNCERQQIDSKLEYKQKTGSRTGCWPVFSCFGMQRPKARGSNDIRRPTSRKLRS